MARLCALLMLVLLVWQPVWHSRVSVPPQCLLAIDDSLSTQNNKASDVQCDVDLLKSILAAKTTCLSDFLAEHNASGIGSPLGDWLAALAAQEHSVDVVCLVSDGITTHGTPIAAVAARFSVPVFCVAVGSDTVSTNIPVLLDDTVTPIKCLFIERSPRPEYRFLRDVLQQLDECSLQTVLLDAEEQTNLTADKIDEFDLVIIGDVDTNKLPAKLFERPVLFIAGEYTASQPGTPLTFTWSDDPVLPLQRRNTKSTVRWGMPLMFDSTTPLRVLARVGEQPLIAIDETLRRCWCGTDELYRLADDNIDPNNREMWRRLITLLARTPDDESFVRVRYEDFDEIKIESRRQHRDTTALKSLAETTGGELFTSGSPREVAHQVATAIRERLANTTRYEIRTVPLIPRWLLFTVAIASLLWAWTKR